MLISCKSVGLSSRMRNLNLWPFSAIFTICNGFLGNKGVRLYEEACVWVPQRLAPLCAFCRGWRLIEEAWRLCTEACASVHARAPLVQIFVSSGRHVRPCTWRVCLITLTHASMTPMYFRRPVSRPDWLGKSSAWLEHERNNRIM